MNKNKHPSITAFGIAVFLTAILFFTPTIEWNRLYYELLSNNYIFYRLILKSFNFWGSETVAIDGIKFLLSLLFLCCLTKLFLLRLKKLTKLLILLALIAFSILFITETSFFKYSTLCAILLVCLSLFSKRRSSSVIFMALAIFANYLITLPLGIGLSLANKYRQSGHIYRLRLFLIIIDASLLSGVFFYFFFVILQ